MQTEQTQLSIRTVNTAERDICSGYTLFTRIYMQNTMNWKHSPETPDTKTTLIQMTRIDKSTGQKGINMQSKIPGNDNHHKTNPSQDTKKTCKHKYFGIEQS